MATAKGVGTVKVTVMGATGLIGKLLVDLLTREGEDVVAASRRSGADVRSGVGLAKACLLYTSPSPRD